ncbi:2,3-bisphosphoglycerate-independent phosphoglycerate mutase [Candidatus Desulfarcum epimagneticum]|uniref:2,3-bisphosphoglycerate-independent phosphoglycerate mutase n=1 Tax=uncultured Desulfobacteraceae bacterium TaxID=218296 RepID=A0A484HGN4_9BACT|nr:2,3-bisphosphoglycerate-independent phosphoglycerate mutase [uncultured Desulfobacteraceae bacterium]
MTPKKPCLLLILDGCGINPDRRQNACALADCPNLDRLMDAYPHTRLSCSGEAVGLPDGTMGNSEVGHLNIGAGRPVLQDLLRINRAVADRSFFQNAAILGLMEKVAAEGASLHIMGLLSDGGVHSHTDHLRALLDMAASGKAGPKIRRVFVHAILDGRDTPPDSGLEYVRSLKEWAREKENVRVATVCGRFYAMDRDKRWDRIEKAFRLYTTGEGNRENDPETAVENAYRKGETDEFVSPTVIFPGDGDPGLLRDGDGVVFFNFRADRAREITRALTDDSFDAFPRDPRPRLSGFVGMTRYDERFGLPSAFPPETLKDTLGETVSRNGLRQLRIAETEKYAHVTYFFNGGAEEPFPLEERCLIPSPREVRTYDLKPEMSAFELTDKVLEEIDSGCFDLMVVNFANMDMVGHTGILPAAIRACEAVDIGVGKVVGRVLEKGGAAIVTSDHGNAEKMADENGGPHTAHTTHPVPFILADDSRKDAALRPGGSLADIAPTVLEIMGVEKPERMTGRSLTHIPEGETGNEKET